MRAFGYCVLVAIALAAYRLSFVFYPLYWARPDFVIEAPAFLLPPGLALIVASTVGLFGLALLVECAVRRKVQAVPFGDAFQKTTRTYIPTLWLLPCLLLFVPGAPGVSPLVAFFILDARHWLASLVFVSCLALKLKGVGTPDVSTSRRAAVLLGFLFLALFALTPNHRFRQAYDERFGTGDEPRYVRIAASLLHDGDVDVSNAAENVGRRFSLPRTVRELAGLPGAVLRTSREAVQTLMGRSPEGKASSLGGQVVAGRRGGEFYVYLPGFPMLLLGPLALDSWVAPGYLWSVMLFCLVLGVVNAFALFRLASVMNLDRGEGLALAMALAITPPLVAYSFQLYPEVAASICLAVCLVPILSESPLPARRELIGFAVGSALLPWLHTKYYPLLGIVLLAFLVRYRHLTRSRLAIMLALPAMAVVLQGLYMFEITGSFLPDALWVLNGYPRGTQAFNAETLSGLYYLFLGRSEGLLVYAPHYVFAVLGLLTSRRRFPWVFWLSLALLVPYVLIAASHDEGGAGGWSPPSRYFVAVTPVFFLGFASWLKERHGPARIGALFVFLAASFWIGVGMLPERNFLYDRIAFQASGAIDPSPFLAFAGAYPALLVFVVLAIRWVEKRGMRTMGAAMCVALFVILAGQAARLFRDPGEWTPARNSEGAATLRPGRSELILFRDCPEPTLRFSGGGTPTALSVRGNGFRRDLVVPSSSTTELHVLGDAFREWTGEGRIDWRLFSLESEPEGARVRVEPVCRGGGRK